MYKKEKMAQLPIHTKCQIITRITRINISKKSHKKIFWWVYHKFNQ